VLDLGEQPQSGLFPRLHDPVPDPRFALRMVMCEHCHLAQLEDGPATIEETRGVEPTAVTAQGDAAVADVVGAGLLRPGMQFLQFPSPHGGTWTAPLTRHGLTESTVDEVDVVADVFGMMHEADQRTALARRVAHLSADGILLLQVHSLAGDVGHGAWHTLRHGHYGYYAVPVLLEMAHAFGLVAVGAWEYPLQGGTTLVALARHGQQADAVTELVDRELREGLTDPTTVAGLGALVEDSVAQVRAYLARSTSDGLTVAGYGAASKVPALLCRAGVGPRDLCAVADASAEKQGRALPGVRIPIISPEELVALRPDRVVLFVSDAIDEVRSALPEIERSGGRWVLIDPLPIEVEPVGQGNRHAEVES
jgi:hypothetical protein